MRLNHVALTVAERERSATFYELHFGFSERVHEGENLLILRSGEEDLLALSEGAVPHERPRTNHFGFQVADADEVRRVRERLREAGVPECEWQEEGGFVRVQVADPDGYLIDVYAY